MIFSILPSDDIVYLVQGTEGTTDHPYDFDTTFPSIYCNSGYVYQRHACGNGAKDGRGTGEVEYGSFSTNELLCLPDCHPMLSDDYKSVCHGKEMVVECRKSGND